MSLGICFIKKLHLVKVGAFAWYSVKICVIFGVQFERRTVDKKKQTYMKTKTCKLYSRVFWIFLPNFIKIDAYYFELCRLKVCAFFLRHSVFLTLFVGACHIDIATSMSWRHVNLSKEHSLAIARPKLSGRRSSSTVLNQVFLGLPVLHRQPWENPECRPGELENGLEWYLKTEDLLVQL